MNSKVLRPAVLLLFLLIGLTANDVSGQITYKIPEGVFPMDWNKNGFKGMLFLEQKSPSGFFIAYPNDDESMDDLRERAASQIAPMIVSDTKDLAKIPFEQKNISSNSKDISDRGRYYFFKGEESSVQIFFFERKTPSSDLVYGYFARRKNDEDKSKIWVGDDQKFPKVFKKWTDSFDPAK